MSAISGRSRRLTSARPLRGISSSPKLRANAICAFVVERLVVKHQHCIAVDRLVERRHVRRLERLPDIDPADLADKQRMQLANADAHRRISRSAVLKR